MNIKGRDSPTTVRMRSLSAEELDLPACELPSTTEVDLHIRTRLEALSTQRLVGVALNAFGDISWTQELVLNELLDRIEPNWQDREETTSESTLERRPPVRFADWQEVVSALGSLEIGICELLLRVPLGVSPRRFRDSINRARNALLRAHGVAKTRSEEDRAQQLKMNLRQQRADKIPELPGHVPARLRPFRSYGVRDDPTDAGYAEMRVRARDQLRRPLGNHPPRRGKNTRRKD